MGLIPPRGSAVQIGPRLRAIWEKNGPLFSEPSLAMRKPRSTLCSSQKQALPDRARRAPQEGRCGGCSAERFVTGLYQPAFFSGPVLVFDMAYAHCHKLGPHDAPQEQCSPGSVLGGDSGQSAAAFGAQSRRCEARPGESLRGDRGQCTPRSTCPSTPVVTTSGLSTPGGKWPFCPRVEPGTWHPCERLQSALLTSAAETTRWAKAVSLGESGKQ